MKIKLNSNQEKAVLMNDGPLRILAGPGSGKTRTLVQKAIYLLENKLTTRDKILLITFTNKAANEIKERLQSEGHFINNVLTYHGFCFKILTLESGESGVDQEFTILDTSGTYRVVRKILNDKFGKGHSYKVANFTAMFGEIAREERGVDSLPTVERDVYLEYTKIKTSKKQLDFDDIIALTLKIFRKSEKLRAKYFRAFDYIFVDEFQDTNDIQFEIIRSFTGVDSNITIVGDPDQNIYSWRGANAKLMNNFEKWYPGVETIYLDQNYRSTKEIINFANKVIENNTERPSDFKSKVVREEKGQLKFGVVNDSYEEAKEISKDIAKKISDGTKPEDIAIIVRVSSYTRILETALREKDIQYKVVGAARFFDRKEIKEALDFLKLINTPNDNDLLLRMINIPAKGIGPQTIEELKHNSKNYKSVWEMLVTEYRRGANNKTTNFVKHLLSAREKFQTNITTNRYRLVSNILWGLLTDVGYLNINNIDPEKKENVAELIELIKEKEEAMVPFTTKIQKEYLVCNVNVEMMNEERTKGITAFLNDIALAAAGDEKQNENSITLMTAHASKGTEYEIVYIPSVIEGHWPSSMAIEQDEIEEERRVFYVASTRAKSELIFSFPSKVKKFNNSLSNARPSRFIEEGGLLDEDKVREQYEKWVPCGSCLEGAIIPKEGRYGTFYACDKYPYCDNVYSKAEFNRKLSIKNAEFHKEKEKEKGTKSNLEKSNHQEGALIQHIKFGKGSIVRVLDEFIIVSFEGMDEELEILIGHHSYELL